MGAASVQQDDVRAQIWARPKKPLRFVRVRIVKA
jgi:hypothetical protein